MKNVKLIITSIITFCLINLQIMTIDLLGVKTVFRNEAQASTGTLLKDSLTGVAVSVVNMSLKNCQGSTPDILAAMAASGVNLVGQMAAVGTNADDKSAQLKQSDYANLKTQEAINAQIKSVESSKKALETKNKFELATVVAYLASAGIALAGKLAVTYLEGVCKTGVKTSVSACEANVAKCVADKKAYTDCLASSTTGAAACHSIYEHYQANCTSFVNGSTTAEDAQLRMNTCKGALAGVDIKLGYIDTSLEANNPSTLQASGAELEVNTMKSSYHTSCGKAPTTLATEQASEAQRQAQQHAGMVTGAAQDKAVQEAAAKSAAKTGTFENVAGLTEALNIAGQVAQTGNAAASAASNTTANVAGTGVSNSLCGNAGTGACTIFGEQLKNSLAKCTEATQMSMSESAEGRYWLAREEEIKQSGHWDLYQEIKNNIFAMITGDSKYLKENLIKKQERILLENGYSQFALTYSGEGINNLNEYMLYHERLGALNGIKESISVLQYSDMKVIFDGMKNDAKTLFKIAAQSGFDLMMPSASAFALGSLVGIGLNLGSYTGVLQSLIGTNATFIDNYMVTYGKRSIVFGASSALTGMAAASTASSIESLKKDLAKLKSLKAELDKAAAGGGGGSGAGSGGGAPAESADTGMNPDISPLKNVEEKDPTVKNAGAETLAKLDQDKIKIGEKDIALEHKVPCITTNCESVKNTLSEKMKKSGIGVGVPAGATSILKKGLQLTAEIADELQGKNKIGAGTLSKLDELAKHKNAMQGALRSMEKSLNKMLKAQGKSPMDFEKLANQIAQSLDGNTDKILLANGMGMNDQMASSSNPKEEKPQNFSMDYKEEQSNDGGNRFAAFNANDPFADKEEKKNDDTASGTDDKANLEQYEDGTVDIVSDTSVPIWTIITTRYVRSALKRLALKPENQ